MPVTRQLVDQECFSPAPVLPYELRIGDFELAMQDVYDFFYDVNTGLVAKGLPRLDDMLRKANLSGMLSDMVTVSLATHSRTLVQNLYHNGHPDLIVQGKYPNESVQSGEHGVEIKTTRKKGGAVDLHGARKQWMCVFVYETDNDTQPAIDRAALRFTEIYLQQVDTDDFRKNNRGELGTRTATLDKDGLKKLRDGWVYRDSD